MPFVGTWHCRVLSIILMLLFLLPTFPSSAQETPFYESTPCRFESPPYASVECGDFHTEDGQRLHVAIFRTSHPNPAPDPIVYLEGGPGFSPLSAVPYVFDDVYAPLLLRRDLIIFDQRGTGFSEPALHCPEIENGGAEGIFACHDRLLAEGIDLTRYTSAASAADVETLRQVLGYEQWNIYSTSYGTRLALTVMRDYPAGIRSVILDSTYPLQVDLYGEFPANVTRALQVLFENCAADSLCSTNYPDLETVFYEQVRQLNDSPAEVTLTHRNQSFKAWIDGYRLVNTIFSALYDSRLIPDLPRRIYASQVGDYETLFGLQSPESAISFSAGLYYALQCNEEVPFSQYPAADYPDIEVFFNRNAVFGKPMFRICDLWQSAEPELVENEAVVSDIPTLILAGEYDPITPPDWGRLAAETLSQSYFYEFRGLGHSVFASDECPMIMTLTFLDDPTTSPNPACMESMLPAHFTLP